jgi:alanine racemase
MSENRMQRVTAEIDLDAVASNLSEVRRRLGPGVKVMGVVKANAYGHGAVGVAERLVAEGADWLAVGEVTEAVELRRAGISLPLLILGPTLTKNIPVVVRYRVSVTVTDVGFARRLDAEAEKAGEEHGVHIVVDTGMGRLGRFPDEIPALAAEIAGLRHLRLEGIFTHFPAPDREVVMTQVLAFRRLLGELGEQGIDPGIRHAANSSAVFLHPESHFDMVRPGIALYGIDPGGLARRAGGRLRPALRLTSEIVFLKDVPAGASIGYRPGYTSPRATRIATIPIGYAHGYSYRFSNRGRVLVRGEEAPVVGRISMDYTTIDVGHVAGVRVGDPVVLVGTEGDEAIRVEDLAQLAGTIPYEISSRLGRRVKRVFKPRG